MPVRVAAVVAWLLSVVAAGLLADSDAIRGYGTFWAAAVTLVSWYFVIGYLAFSTGWRQNDEGAALLTVTLVPAVSFTLIWVTRVFLTPPANPTAASPIVWSGCFFVMLWWATILTVRQIAARRELKERNASA